MASSQRQPPEDQPSRPSSTASFAQTRQQARAQGSATQTQTETQTPAPPHQPTTVLRLRGAHAPSNRTVTWAEDVVNNEGLGRKSSKVCCIYHRPRGVDESSDESSSSDSSDSESDGGAGDGGARPVGGSRKGKGKDKGKGKHGDDCGDHRHGRKHGRRDGSDGNKRRPSPNAYERVPKPRPKDGPSGTST